MFSDELINDTLIDFIHLLQNYFGERLTSIVLYGSVVFDDLAPGYGDLDFITVIYDFLSEKDCTQLAQLRKPLRDGEGTTLTGMLEGAFLPRCMLDPAQPGIAFWWGTNGERIWQKNRLGWITLREIREFGKVIWGEDVRLLIPPIPKGQLLQEIWEICKTIEQYGKGGSLHSVDWLFTAARELLFLKEGQFCSKSEAADWAYLHAIGEWKECLPLAKKIRLNPDLVNSSNIQAWLNNLMEPIQSAGKEIKAELINQGFE